MTTAPQLPGYSLFRQEDGSWQCFQPDPNHPPRILRAAALNQVLQLLQEAETLRHSGHHLIGMIAYDAAHAFDSALPSPSPHPRIEASTFPSLIIFAFPSPPKTLLTLPAPSALPSPIELAPELSSASYLNAIHEILDLISRGDSYQVNYTFRCRGPSLSSPLDTFLHLYQRHPTPHAAYLDCGDFQLLSHSPEAFLESNGDRVISRPMKGTAPASSSASQLSDDPKNRAENVMIVDMVRNDLAKIAVPGSVSVPHLFTVQSFRSLRQMISTVTATLAPDTSLANLLSATFPPASITGAPKVRSCQLIRQLEPSPRLAYTGSIFSASPFPKPQLRANVAIRTLINFPDSFCELGIGSGIVADSIPQLEWEECLLKATFADLNLADFSLFETFRRLADGSYRHLDAHLNRLARSQLHFARPWFPDQIHTLLCQLPHTPHDLRIKINLAPDGTPSISSEPAPEWPTRPLRLTIATTPVSASDFLLRHKTTRRSLYDQQLKSAQSAGFDEVLFTNSDGFITEGSFTNLFIDLDGQWLTPPIHHGLLPGIWRHFTLRELSAHELPISLDMLQRAQQILIGNSLRGSASALLFQHK